MKLTIEYREPLMQLFFGVVHVGQVAYRSQVRELVAAGFVAVTSTGYYLITAQGVDACVTRGWESILD
jgi:hypothetical protein